MLRVVHLSTADIQGGAARSAHRLHRALLDEGVESRMLVLNQYSADEEVSCARVDIGTPLSREARWGQKYFIDANRTEKTNSYFSLPLPGFDLASNALVQKSDIIHLHWVTGFLSPRSIDRLQGLGKPVFWTLHDQRAFTGGCHFSSGCHGFESECAGCPQLDDGGLMVARAALKESKQSIDSSRVDIICPSNWMANMVQRSSLLGNANISTIPYCVDIKKFKPHDKRQARAKLGMDAGKTCLLFGADNCEEKRKGLHLLRTCFESLDPAKYQLLAFGDDRGAFSRFPIAVRSFGRIHSDHELAALYSAADAFLLPSSEDNLPNTMLEALACGTAIIGFAIGGLVDVITPEVGILANTCDGKAFAAAIGTFTVGARSQESIRQIAQAYSPARIASLHMELYRKRRQADRRGVPIRSKAKCLSPGVSFACVFGQVVSLARKKRRSNLSRRLLSWVRLS